MSLQDVLREIKNLPNSMERTERYARTAELVAAEEKRRIRGVGDRAPEFSLSDPRSGRVSSTALLEQGPLVINFYRGLWCSYCQLDLVELEQAVVHIRLADASVIAIAHGIGSRMDDGVAAGRGVSFPVLDDKDGRVAEKFGLRWAPADAQVIETELGMNIVTLRDTGPWIFPMQARYVIDQNGLIAFADIVYNWDNRSEPMNVVSVLGGLRQGRPGGDVNWARS